MFPRITTCMSLLLALWMTPPADGAPVGQKPKVILVSMDGFRHDYLTKVNSTPNFDRMLREGVTMPWINNTFTTLTFPCHFTMVTGLYEESHGIIGNNMYDPEMDPEKFWMGTTDEEWWTGHDTIWTSAQKAGLKSGVYFWVGSSSEIQGTRPERYFRFNGSVPFEQRVDTLVEWMTMEDFDLGLIYFNEPDHTGHVHGPDGTETLHEVERMDGILGRLLSQLDQANATDNINIIVTSDHGMAAVNSDTQMIDLREYVNNSLVKDVVSQGPVTHLLPQPGKAQELADALKDVEHMTTYLKEDIPERFHYKDNRRVQPVVLIADEGWSVSENATWRWDRNNMPLFLGDHGFDNNLKSMKPIFVARGPAFKKNATVETMKTVDIYPLICHLLNIDPAPNNGSLARAAKLLLVDPTNAIGSGSSNDGRNGGGDPDWSTKTEVCSGLVALLFVLTQAVSSAYRF